MDKNELYLAQIISSSGNARSLCYETLQLFKSNKFDDGKTKYEEAKAELIQAKKIHAELLRQYACSELNNIDLLVIHAEDHMNSSQVIFEMVNEFIYIYQNFKKQD